MLSDTEWKQRYIQRYQELVISDQYRPAEEYIETFAGLSYAANCRDGEAQADPIATAEGDYAEFLRIRRTKGRV
jgi:hypothetical protein